MTAKEKKDNDIFLRCDILLSDYPKYVKEWYTHLRINKTAASTCEVYLNRITEFMVSIRIYDINEIPAEMITANKVEEFLLDKQYKIDRKTKEKTTTSSSYQQGIWITMNNFLDFMTIKGYIPENYIKTQGIKKPKMKDEIKRYHTTKEDLGKILNVIEENGRYSPKMYRDKAIALLFMTTGMRRSALDNLDLSNFDIKMNKLNSNILTSVVDKGEKYHEYNLTQQTVDAINDWLVYRQNYVFGTDEQALFVNASGKRLSGNALYVIVTNACEKALGVRLSPHKLRGAFITIMTEETGDILAVSEAVGHANVRTTQRYVAQNGRGKRMAAQIMEGI